MANNIFTDISEILKAKSDKNFALTIGNFDGVHLGHQYLLKKYLAEIKKNNLESIVLTFKPHPMITLKNAEMFLLTDYSQRNELLFSAGVENIIQMNFNRDLSTLAPDDFLEKYIFVSNNVKEIYVGHDFVFGENKTGDYQFIEEYCSKKNKRCFQLDRFSNNKEQISSTHIRELLRQGDVTGANRLLGREFSLKGSIIKGKQRGRVMGFPTANLQLNKSLITPSTGVYITKCHVKDMEFNSVTNIGVNPTFEQKIEISVETHILDFDSDIYGEEIVVTFKERIRPEKKFNSVNMLIDQIQNDIKHAREFFRK